jgi:hypothetical protein
MVTPGTTALDYFQSLFPVWQHSHVLPHGPEALAIHVVSVQGLYSSWRPTAFYNDTPLLATDEGAPQQDLPPS